MWIVYGLGTLFLAFSPQLTRKVNISAPWHRLALDFVNQLECFSVQALAFSLGGVLCLHEPVQISEGRMMSDMKTVQSQHSVASFLKAVQNPRRRDDAQAVVAMMQDITGKPAKMWGPSIIGFDRYYYKRKDGSAHSFMITGLSPRKAALTLYTMPGFSNYGDLMERLGRFKTSKSCLYITRLENVDLDVLRELITRTVEDMRAIYH